MQDVLKDISLFEIWIKCTICFKKKNLYWTQSDVWWKWQTIRLKNTNLNLNRI
jgi:hypothetical protein